jgi:hypothetical protein
MLLPTAAILNVEFSEAGDSKRWNPSNSTEVSNLVIIDFEFMQKIFIVLRS